MVESLRVLKACRKSAVAARRVATGKPFVRSTIRPSSANTASDLDVRQGKLLRQRHGGDVLQDPEIELVWRTIFCTRQEADEAIGRYIDGFYNPVRRHSALDFTSPTQFEKRSPNDQMPL